VLAGAALLLALVQGCASSPTPFALQVAQGERAESAGRYREAAARFDEAARVAEKPRDREHAAYLAAMVMLRAGDVADADRRLAPIATATPPGEHAAEAAWRRARFRIDTGSPEEARAAVLDVALRFPSSGVGRVALLRLLDLEDEAGGPAHTLDRIDALRAGPLGSSDLAELLEYQRALRVERTGRAAEARDALVACARSHPYPHGKLTDDALWRASEIDLSLGRIDAAIEDLAEMVRDLEHSHMTGSYVRPRFEDALFRIAVLQRDQKHDRAAARAAFRRVFDELPDSRLRDDAAWAEAELALADGDGGAACSRLSSLVSARPHSRYVPCATELCPSVERPKESRAPTECRDYIKRKDRTP
jgi:tetratricopeptide (TPR) repeat protein